MKYSKIKTIKRDSKKEDVYDLSVKDNHNFFANNLLVHNCSEYVSIQYSSCNLGSVNVTKFVKYENNGKSYFDWNEFEQCIRGATRFLDSVIDVNEFPINKIEEVTKKVRPIGLGIMGFSHTLYMLGIPFNSLQGIKFAEDITKTLTLTGMDESCEMAKEKGSYPAYDEETFFKANDRFFRNGQNKELADKIRNSGISNSCNTSLAPTGSISYLANVSGGIEPVFALTYARKIEKLNKEYETVYISDPLFDGYLNNNYDTKTKESILKQVADNKGSCQTVNEIPLEHRKVFVVASDLTPMEHLESLAACAPNISTSCSKTINMPSDATREDISEVYLKAHELGVIGVTVYRDGCREGILVHSTKDDKELIVKTNSPKRPKSLPCHVYKFGCFNRITNESEKWIVFVGLLEDEPYEIIAGKIVDVDIPNSITEGYMVKTKMDGRKVYQFHYNGEVLVDDVKSAFLNDIREYVTRLMSWGLRHGGGINYLREVLQKSNGTIVDFNKVIIRAISRYIKETESKEKCPVCNSDLKYVEGCVKCSDPMCSFTRCGG